MPDASVEVLARTTGLVRQTRTDASGGYRVAGLPNGTYLVTVTKDAFQTAVYDDVRLEVGQTRALDIALTVGAVTSEVMVTAQATAVDTRTAELGAAVGSAQIEALPLNGRNWASMMAFAPGATNTGEGSQNNIRFFGRARDDNNWTFDGVDATGVKDPRTEASLRLVMSTEAISEFRVSSTNFSADAGTGAGAQVNLVSKGGTNQFRGGVFEYFRDEALDQRRVLDTLPTEPPFRLNQYGFSLGGPVVRSKTFFFVTYEGLRQTLDTANDRSALVPSAAFRAQVQALQPALAPVMAAYPLGTARTTDPNIDEYRGRKTLKWNEDSFLVRLDHRLGNSTSLVARLNGVNGLIDSEVRSDLLETRRSEAFPKNFTAQWQQIVSPRTVAEFKFGWNLSPLDRVDQGLGAEGYEIRNAFTPTRATFINEEKPQSRSYLGSLLTTMGAHTVKFGGEFRQIDVNVGNGPGVAVRWNSIADFLINRTNRIRVDGELPLQEGRRWYGVGYGQTEWRAGDALTINLGVRYEYYSVMTEASGAGNVLDLDRCPPTGGAARRLWHLLQPRAERRRHGGDRQPGEARGTDDPGGLSGAGRHSGRPQPGQQPAARAPAGSRGHVRADLQRLAADRARRQHRRADRLRRQSRSARVQPHLREHHRSGDRAAAVRRAADHADRPLERDGRNRVRRPQPGPAAQHEERVADAGHLHAGALDGQQRRQRRGQRVAERAVR